MGLPIKKTVQQTTKNYYTIIGLFSDLTNISAIFHIHSSFHNVQDWHLLVLILHESSFTCGHILWHCDIAAQ